MSESPAILVLRQSLQKSFQAIQQQQEAWQQALAECKPLLSALSNLAEQMQACQKVTFAQTPLRAFPDLEELLKYKQRCAAEILLEELGGKIADLQKVRDAVSGYVGSVFQLYEQHADVLGFEASVQRAAPNPSLADMLEWLHDIERYYRHVHSDEDLLSGVSVRGFITNQLAERKCQGICAEPFFLDARDNTLFGISMKKLDLLNELAPMGKGFPCTLL